MYLIEECNDPNAVISSLTDKQMIPRFDTFERAFYFSVNCLF